MKVLLISCSNIVSMTHGYTEVSALLKQAGHSVDKVILVKEFTEEYSDENLSHLDALLDKADLVMMSLFTLHAARAVVVTEYIRAKYPNLKIFWGGPHCISAPEISLKFADGVCFAEGDLIISELMDRLSGVSSEDYLETPNMAFRIDGKTIINKTLQPNEDLDSLPDPDVGIEDLYALDYRLEPFTWDMIDWYNPVGPKGLWITTSRGCPFKCSYCNNSRFINMHGHNRVRFQSVESIIVSMEKIMKQRDGYAWAVFSDDDFMSRPLAQIQELHDKYLERVNLPFCITSSAATYTDEKMALIVDAGSHDFRMGVQSGSERVLREVYSRTIDLPKTRDVAWKISAYTASHGVRLILDFIIDCPYETPDDIIESYKYILDAPPAYIEIFVLQFFPGTELYNRAVADGYIEQYDFKVFRDFSGRHIVFQKNYETFLVLSASRLKERYPRWFLLMLASTVVRTLARLLPWKYYLNVLKANGVMTQREVDLSK